MCVTKIMGRTYYSAAAAGLLQERVCSTNIFIVFFPPVFRRVFHRPYGVRCDWPEIITREGQPVFVVSPSRSAAAASFSLYYDNNNITHYTYYYNVYVGRYTYKGIQTTRTYTYG